MSKAVEVRGLRMVYQGRGRSLFPWMSARAVAYEPYVLPMDEPFAPFAAVDAQTQAELEDLPVDLPEGAAAAPGA